ncbi:ribonuclease E activity regulator RraA [Phaeovulum sp. W22_SRMD_FR3]|uniref:ribonuclease E activity regulator RraA n=1 Tax=Phaeovulum sp. W22_SRMD_FR3 TaxID=3240274 RepID=UPI003F9CE1DC
MKTADLYDAHGAKLTLVDLPWQKFGAKPFCAGPVQTVKCFEDNTLVRAELEKPGAGRILVVDGGASSRMALLGDVLAELSIANGWAGIAVNGAIRDRVEIDGMAQCVFALGTTPVKSVKRDWGIVGTEVAFGGVRFAPGGWLYADADGLLYSPVPLA